QRREPTRIKSDAGGCSKARRGGPGSSPSWAPGGGFRAGVGMGPPAGFWGSPHSVWFMHSSSQEGVGEKTFRFTGVGGCGGVGGGARDDEPITPYTPAETMDAGWCWQIEHEFRINRGYVYSSDFIADDAAEKEFRAKNPKVSSTRVVKFVSGRYERSWVKNVV